jgi:DNA-binding NarL/FixJ family response regulator
VSERTSGGAQGAAAPIRVVLADDQEMVRSGLRLILESEPDIEVVGEASDGAEALETIRWRHPDVVLMDVQMPVLDGLAATRRLLDREDPRIEPVPRVIMLTTFDLDEYIFEALRAGASGFLLKNAPADDLVAAVRTVAAGDALLAPSVTRRVIAAFGRRRAPSESARDLARLSEREREVLLLVARGRSNAEIAAELAIGEATVKTHLSSLFAKLGLRDRVEAVIFAYESGMVEPGVD